MKKTFIRKALLALLASTASLSAGASVVINEAMPCNLGTYMDMGTYNYLPYVELYNSGEEAVNLNGYYFMYKPLEEDTIKEAVIDYDCKLAAGAHMLFYFDKDVKKQHVSYKMDADGGELTLLDASGKAVSTLNMPAMPAYVSYGVGADGPGFMVPTPQKANGTVYAAKSLADFTMNKQCAKPAISAPGVVIEEGSATVTMSCATTGAKIYYTTNGSVPTEANGTLYEKPLTLEKNTVLRARAYASGKVYSDIATSSFIFADEKHSFCMGLGKLPIVSVVTDEKNMTDKTIGIGVKGDNGTTGICASIGRANYNQDWKRPMNFEYIVGGKTVVNNEVEAKVMGGCSRQYEVKSLALAANKKCGSGKNKMKYAFFSDKPANTKYKSLHLRNGGNDYDGLRIRDGFMQSLIHGTSIDYQAYQPVAYYLNGKYQGLMLLNEHANDDYVYTNYGLDEEEIDFIKFPKSIEVTCGDLEAYNHMMAESRTGQNQGGYYDKMNKLMDMEEYMTYMAFEQYIVNTDWPGNNQKIWRKRSNGRFRWLLYDTDFGFGMYEGWGPNYTTESTDMLKFCLGEGSAVNWGNGSNNAPYNFDAASKWKTELFANLMKDEEFKTRFLTKNLMLLATNFVPEKVIAKLDSIAEDAYPELCAMSANKYYTPNLDEDETLKGMKQFAKNRPANVMQHLASYYGGSAIDLGITSNTEGARFIINGLYWDKSSYASKYISNNPLTITPIAPEGYAFKGWKMSSSASANLLGATSSWSYLHDHTAAPEGWTTAKTAPAGWKKGNGTFGFGGKSHYDTELDYGTDPADKPMTAYFHTTVNVDDVDNYAGFTANFTYDDGYILYVNGKEVDRKNISATEVTYDTPADEYMNDATAEVKIDAKHFVTGSNTIAVEVHQVEAKSSDLTFAMSLRAQGKSTGATSTAAVYNGTVTDDFSIQALFEATTETGGIVLNEVCTSNKSENGHADEYGKFGDWIELHNTSNRDINVAGWFITDNAGKLDKYQIPTTTPEETMIPAHGYKLIWCDNDVWNGPLHASFKLSESAKNTIVLSKNKGGAPAKADEATIPANLGANNSYGRTTDGASTWVKFGTCASGITLAPTPNEQNGSVECLPSDSERISTDAEKRVALYPNPVGDELNIATKGEQLQRIAIHDVAGRQVLAQTASGATATIGTSHLASGVYTVNIETTSANVRLKFIKK